MATFEWGWLVLRPGNSKRGFCNEPLYHIIERKILQRVSLKLQRVHKEPLTDECLKAAARTLKFRKSFQFSIYGPCRTFVAKSKSLQCSLALAARHVTQPVQSSTIIVVFTSSVSACAWLMVRTRRSKQTSMVPLRALVVNPFRWHVKCSVIHKDSARNSRL